MLGASAAYYGASIASAGPIFGASDVDLSRTVCSKPGRPAAALHRPAACGRRAMSIARPVEHPGARPRRQGSRQVLIDPAGLAPQLRRFFSNLRLRPIDIDK